MFILKADKNRLWRQAREPLTSGSVNVNAVRFEFSPDWEGLTRTAVFEAGEVSRSVLLDGSGECAIPWEVLRAPDVRLRVGVYGKRGEELVLPTVWESLGIILEGVSVPEEESRPPAPDIWQQELARKADALDYDGLNLTLLSGEKALSTAQIAGGGGPAWRIGHGLKLVGGNLTVDSVDDFQGDNTLPMTAAGVHTMIGNIGALLGTI